MRNSNPPLGTCLMGRISKRCLCHGRRPSSTLTPPVQKRTHLRDAEGPTGRQRNDTAGRWNLNDSRIRPRNRRTRWKTRSGQEREKMETTCGPPQGPPAPLPQEGAKGRPGAPRRKTLLSKGVQRMPKRPPDARQNTQTGPDPELHLPEDTVPVPSTPPPLSSFSSEPGLVTGEYLP
jgi:hypothetical protein